MPPETAQQFEENAQKGAASGFNDETFSLLHQDEQQEKGLIKILLEHGAENWDEQISIAEYILNEGIIEEMIDNGTVLKILNQYKEKLAAHQPTSDKDFIFSEDQDVSALVVSILNTPYELSQRWQEEKTMFGTLEQGFRKYMGIEYHHKPLVGQTKDYKDNIISTLQYLKLKKIKRLLEANLTDLEANNTYQKFLQVIDPHMHIKDMEREITKITGSVIKKL
jgi:DNA primase